jgi:hypothetical protein
MKTFLTILLATLCAATGYGQTIKSLGYNTTNGEVVYSGTNALTFTNALGFTSAAAGATRTNIGLGATNNVTFSNVAASEFKSGTNFSAFVVDSPVSGSFQFKTTNTNDGAVYLQSYTNSELHKSAILGIRGNDMFLQSSSTNVRVETTEGDLANLDADTISVSNASATRTNLGLPLAALTNTSITNFQAALFSTNAAPTNTTNVSGWIQFYVGTNSVRVPYYQ